MDVLIDPEPDAEQREAVELALADLLARDEASAPSRSNWWKAGVAENLEDGAPDEHFHAKPS
jgi:hypothetical protein